MQPTEIQGLHLLKVLMKPLCGLNRTLNPTARFSRRNVHNILLFRHSELLADRRIYGHQIVRGSLAGNHADLLCRESGYHQHDNLLLLSGRVVSPYSTSEVCR